MQCRTLAGASVMLIVFILVLPVLAENASTGTLVFDVKSLESDVDVTGNMRKQLEHAGLRWGLTDKVLVVPLVSEKFVKSDLPHLTRYGEQKSIDLEAGTYHVTCIGYVHSSNSRDVDKVLSKSAFFNEEVVTFEVTPGKTTVLRIRPVLQKQKHTSFLLKAKIFMPDLWTTVIEDGVEKEGILINERTEASLAWDDYSGPLKH